MTLRRLVASSAAVAFARVAGAAVAFLTQALIARAWGGDELGRFLLAVAAVNLTAAALTLGFPVVGAYFAAEYGARGWGRALSAFCVTAARYAAILTAVFAAVAALAEWAGWRDGVLAALWRPAFVFAVAVAAVAVASPVLVGLKRPLQGFAPDTVIRPLVMLAAFAATATLGAAHGLPLLFTLAAAAYGVVAVACVIAAARALRTVPPGEDAVTGAERRRWWRYALPWAVIAAATDMFFDADLLLLAPMLSHEDMAVFGVCARLFALCAFAVGSIYLVTMPGIFDAGGRDDKRAFLRKVGDANAIATACALALTLASLGAGPLLSLVFGEAFAAGATPLAIMCAGLVVRSALGPAPLVLTFHDRPYAGLPPVACGFTALIALNVALTPAYGIDGAAMAAFAAMTAWSAAQWAVARAQLGMDISVWPMLRRALPV